ncbi:30622_t:CDS:2, partial [Racocetra persica]
DESSFTNSDIELIYKNDIEMVQKSGQTNFEANFSHMSVEILKFLCHEMGVSETGSKQDLVSCLVNESRKRYVLSNSDISVKEKVVDIDSDMKEVPGEGSKLSFKKAFANTFNNVLVDSENLVTNRCNILSSPQLAKARNQWEYNEWCKASLLLDKALYTDDINYVQLARQVVLERVYVVKVADKDGWNVVVRMVSGDMLDLISELFSRKYERARMDSAQVQVSSLYMPLFIQPQPFVYLNW